MKVFRHLRGRVRAPLPSLARIRRILRAVLRHEKARARGEFNVVFVDDAFISRLNRTFLGHHGTTDVIAFPYDEFGGDIYVCTAEARRNAEAFRVTYEAEIVRLIVHGMLHLLGHDDHAPKRRKVMWAAQEKLVARELAR